MSFKIFLNEFEEVRYIFFRHIRVYAHHPDKIFSLSRSITHFYHAIFIKFFTKDLCIFSFHFETYIYSLWLQYKRESLIFLDDLHSITCICELSANPFFISALSKILQCSPDFERIVSSSALYRFRCRIVLIFIHLIQIVCFFIETCLEHSCFLHQER